MKTCPKCNGVLKKVTNGNVTLFECTSCLVSYNEQTGETTKLNAVDKSVIVLCPSCKGKLRVDAKKSAQDVVCSYCAHKFKKGYSVDSDIDVIVTCPHCSAKNKVKANRGNLNITCGKCKNAFSYYSGEKALTDDVFKKQDDNQTPKKVYSQDEKTIIILCPSCKNKLRVDARRSYYVVDCPHCNTEFEREDSVNQNIDVWAQCPHCGGKNKVKANHGNLIITCGKCKDQFSYYSGEKDQIYDIPPDESREGDEFTQEEVDAFENGNYTEDINYTYETQSEPSYQEDAPKQKNSKNLPKRNFYFYWAGSCEHLFNKMNLFNKSKSASVFVDDVDYGSIDGELHIEVTANQSHTVYASAKILGSMMSKRWAFDIPADGKDYVFYVYQEKGGAHRVVALPVGDEFAIALGDFVRNMFKKKGIRDRFNMSSSDYIIFDVTNEYFELSWPVDKPKGWKQWSTGKDDEKIYYKHIGLTPPSGNWVAQTRYYEALKMVIADVINEDDTFDANYSGTIRYNSRGRLY